MFDEYTKIYKKSETEIIGNIKKANIVFVIYFYIGQIYVTTIALFPAYIIHPSQFAFHRIWISPWRVKI